MSVDIGKYFPLVYKDVEEIQQIVNTENKNFNVAEDELNTLLDNQFIMTSNERAISYRENELGIMANPSVETLDFRRIRLMNRISMQPPFTTKFLRERLDELIGVGKYTLTIDYDNYTIYIESVAENQVYAHEVAVTLTRIKPANMVYVNLPTISDLMLVNEEVSTANLVYNYRLGVTWNLGQKPFLSYSDEVIKKMASVPSIANAGLLNAAKGIADNIKIVLINGGQAIITDFISVGATVKNNVGVVTLSYQVTPDSGIDTIYTINILDKASTNMFVSNLYVPVEQSVIMKHTIRIKEGL